MIEVYFVNNDNRVIKVCHRPDLVEPENLVGGIYIDEANKPALPTTGKGEQVAAYVIDGILEYRIEQRPLTAEEIMQEKYEALERQLVELNARLDLITNGG